jgi:hypothetical protein
VKAIIAKRAQERILLESRTEGLRLERAYAPSQTRAPVTATAVVVTAARVPRHEEGTKNKIKRAKKNSEILKK